MLQRGSPYLEDVNWAITLAREIGLIDAQFRKYVPHAKKCNTHTRVRKSHYDKVAGTVEVFQLKNIYGMLMLLAMGLVSSVSAFITGRVL